jgi:uncharacterized short protein YbdD (DUF466 family)
MTSKINKVIGDFLKKEFIPFFGTEAIKFLSLDFDTESETYNKLLEHLSQKYDETYVNVVKKRSPRKTPKKEEETDVDLTYEEYVEKQEKHPDEVLCSWIFGRGDKANRHCARVVTNKDVWSEKQISDYEVRCEKCKRNNSEKANATNKGRYLKIKIGNQVKGTPTPGVSLPESENDVPSMHSITGLKEGVVSPTPENFLSGQDTGNVTPTKAKKRKSPEKLKIKKIKHGSKDDYTDYRSSQEINGHYILVRKNHEEDEFTFGGKFENEDDFDNNLYIQGVTELDEEDLSELEKYSYKYKYCGASKKKSPEIPEIPDLDDEDENDGGGDDDEDENVDDLLAGLDVN